MTFKKVQLFTDDILDYVFSMNTDQKTMCKMIPAERELLRSFAEDLISNENDFIVAAYDKEELKGVFFLIYEPKDKYLELTGGYAEEAAVYRDFFGFMKKTYSESTLDMVLNPQNKAIIEAAELKGVKFDEEQIEMRLDDFCPSSVPCEVVHFSERYKDEYKAMHEDDENYWTAEKVIAAKDIFRIYIALVNKKAIGYIDVTYTKSENEIYNLFVIPEYKKLGYEAALIQEAVTNNNGDGMIFVINESDDYIRQLCIQLGFQESAHMLFGKVVL